MKLEEPCMSLVQPYNFITKQKFSLTVKGLCRPVHCLATTWGWSPGGSPVNTRLFLQFQCIIVLTLLKPQAYTKCSHTLFIYQDFHEPWLQAKGWCARHYKYTFVLVFVAESQAVLQLAIFLLPQPLWCWGSCRRLSYSSWYKYNLNNTRDSSLVIRTAPSFLQWLIVSYVVVWWEDYHENWLLMFCVGKNGI